MWHRTKSMACSFIKMNPKNKKISSMWSDVCQNCGFWPIFCHYGIYVWEKWAVKLRPWCVKTVGERGLELHFVRGHTPPSKACVVWGTEHGRRERKLQRQSGQRKRRNGGKSLFRQNICKKVLIWVGWLVWLLLWYENQSLVHLLCGDSVSICVGRAAPELTLLNEILRWT